MKQYILTALAVAALAACNSDDIQEADTSRTVAMTFNVHGDFTLTTHDFTRALTADGKDMTDVWVIDYVGTKCQQTIHQQAGDADFGTPTIELGMGTHHLYFVASRGVTPTVDNDAKTITWATVRDTFWKHYELTVTGGTSGGSRAVELDRVVTRIRVVATDEVPADVATVAVTPAMWYYGIDYRTGEPAVARQDYERSVAVLASYIGTQGTLAVNIFGFSGAEWTTEVTVTSKRSDGTVISSATVSDVPFRKNRSTEMIGAVFAKVGVNTITLNDEWLNAFGVEF